MTELGQDPFASDASSVDLDLVRRAAAGSKEALSGLVARHHSYVFNIAMKMFGRREDAEDLTQEVFVKVITALQTFKGDSEFRTWLYRITVNHFLRTRRRAMELHITDGAFEQYFDTVAAIPDDDAPGEIGGAAVEELRLRCTTGMLMCFDREQRLTFILGAMFAVPHEIGAEILEISVANFRVRLHRARNDLYSWMNNRCGLINQANPCRCRKKTRALVDSGLVDPRRLVFNADHVARMEDVSKRHAGTAMETVERLHESVFLAHPFQVSKSHIVEEILDHQGLRTFFALD
jgi:RNA polymerase sigma factor (sigma-70 family)